jgi:tRNA(His) 5'-end guanylyltransferase
MKTAVEWIETRAEEREINNPNESAYWHLRELIKDFQQAKEMEKEQIKDAFIFSKDPFGVSIGNSHTIKKAEDYYNTTFKSE